jgi:hypothetical protein
VNGGSQLRHRLFAIFLGLTIVIATPALVPTALAQNARKPATQSKPAPRWPNGRPRFSSLPGDKAVWQPNGRPLMADAESASLYGDNQGRGAFAGPPIPGKPKESEVPFQDWARELYKWREANLFEPHTRCKPSGGTREFIVPGGIEFFDSPDLADIFIVDETSPSTYNVIYMDGRPHPKDLVPSYYGHSVGHWEGDTLVVDTVGFNERFWIDRQGIPHTEKMHLTQRLTRVDFDNIRIDITFDDPGAYTRPWTTGFWIKYTSDTEWDEAICQENNQASDLLIGAEVGLVRKSPIVP